MKTFTVTFLLFVATETISTSILDEKWAEFKENYGRLYQTPEEEDYRKSVFQTTLTLIETHNQAYRSGLETYEIGINVFADRTMDELNNDHKNINIPDIEPASLIKIFANATKSRTALPDFLDWRDYGIVAPVKDQGGCGSCWAFSAVAALESHYMIKSDKNVSLSEQQLVDCVYPGRACQGGWMTEAYNYIAQNNGINLESDYPYEGREQTCRYEEEKPKVTIKGYAALMEANEEVMKTIVAMEGPVSVALNGKGKFKLYSNGVYYNHLCSNEEINHGVVIVGYGRENSIDYWLVKNSWGLNWGNEGYIKIARNLNSHCGIANATFYPVL